MLDRVTIERMRALADERPIAVAVSGGGDSLALLHLLADEWGAANLRALVVDHALRDGSRSDALAACESAQALGVEARLLTLEWAGAPTRAQQAARRARYRRLAVAAKAAGANLIALGHTADDQAETVLMRAAAGSGWRGLAGIAATAPAPVWPEGLGVALARPLLGVRRAALRVCLERRATSWIEDPANANTLFERVRVRARLAELEAAGLDPARLTRLAARLRVRVIAVDREAADLIERAARFEGPSISVDASQWRGDPEARTRALSILLTAAAGSERAPDLGALERLEFHMVETGFRGATLGGATLQSRGGAILIERDPGAVLGRAGGPGPLPSLDLPCGERVVWDGRAALTAQSEGLRAEPKADGSFAVVATDGPRPLDEVAVEWLLEAHARHVLAFR